MKNKKFFIFYTLCPLLIGVFFFLNTPSLQASIYTAKDNTIENTYFLTAPVAGGDLRVSAPFKANISAQQSVYDDPANGRRYLPNDDNRYNVFGEGTSHLTCHSLINNTNMSIYLTGNVRATKWNDTTEWESFLNHIVNNTNNQVTKEQCFCTDTTSRYRLQTGARCGQDYCLNQDCVASTQTNYPANRIAGRQPCLPDTGYHIFSCTNDYCAYEDGATQVPAKKAIYKTGTNTIGNATEIHNNRKNAFCEVCITQQISDAKVKFSRPAGLSTNYKITNLKNTPQQSQILSKKTVSWSGYHKEPIITVCFRYQPSSTYNANHDCTKTKCQ